MPEGHTIHRLAKDHRGWFVGQNLIVCSPQGRFAKEAKKIHGRKLCDVSAHGKHLFYHWDRNLITHVHLGLYGKFRIFKNPPPEPRGAVRVRAIGAERAFDLVGPNRCELLNQSQYEKLRARLGEDPLRDDASPNRVWDKIRKTRSAIGSVLLNQSIIAGVGNVYRAEILFLLGIHPQLPANKISAQQFDQLWKLTVELLKLGVRHNRIITAGIDSKGKVPKNLRGAERLNIYKKSNCPNCERPVRSWELANRKIYACNHCQKL